VPSPLPGTVRPACAEKETVNNMVKTNTTLLTDLIIVSSLSTRKRLIENLSQVARQAYFARDYARLKTAGEKLVEFSPQSEHIGRYYLALAESRQSREGNKGVRGEFELLTESSIAQVRGAALTASAGAQIVLGDVGRLTQDLLLEASTLSLNCGDLHNFIQSQSQLSLLCSLNGNHQESLQILRGLQPAVDRMSSFCDAIKSDFYNSVAYELLQTGKIESAAYFIKSPLNSRHLLAYPEWQETAVEIIQSIPTKNQPRIFVPYRKPDNVVDHEEFQTLQAKAEAAKAQNEPAQIEQENYEYPSIVVHINNYKFAIVHLSENRGIAGKTIQIYGLSLEELTSRWGDKGTLLIKSFFCHKKEVRLLSEEKILPAHLSHLKGLLKDLAMLPESLFYDTIDNERATDEEVDRIWEYVAPMLENSK
jgi:hypothetical protein